MYTLMWIPVDSFLLQVINAYIEMLVVEKPGSLFALPSHMTCQWDAEDYDGYLFEKVRSLIMTIHIMHFFQIKMNIKNSFTVLNVTL